MANIAFGSKYFIFSKFSSIPKTSKIEADKANLIKEFNELNEFKQSSELKDFLTLGKYLESKDYQNLRSAIDTDRKKEQDKIKQFEAQKKSKTFKNYFKFKVSSKLKDFLAFADSKELREFKELEKTVTSKKFEEEKKTFENQKLAEEKKASELTDLKKSKSVSSYLKLKDTDNKKELNEISGNAEVKKFLELEKVISSTSYKEKLAAAIKSLASLNSQYTDYQHKKKSKKIKDFYHFQNSAKYKSFQAFEKSKELADYLALEKYLQSSPHKDLLKSLDEKDAAEKEKKSKHEAFKNSKKYKWYLSLKDADKFSSLSKWELVFEDDFNDKQLDKKKWMTRYFWGDKLINNAYAFETDKAFPTDGKNVETGNSLAKIITRSEKAKGMMWKQPFGFIPTDFNYTSGLISTAGSHRQKYGKIEAKIKINYSKPVDYHFWMASQMNLPHVDILKVAGKKTKVDMANLYGNIAAKKAPEKKTGEYTGLDISQDFFIYSLEWTKEKLTWKINGVTVNEQTQGVPQEEMYLVFSCNLTGKTDHFELPASMEIDWVRCYKQA
jgi:beta-glucanase (GH16 family)